MIYDLIFKLFTYSLALEITRGIILPGFPLKALGILVQCALYFG